jgi:hypothetical protein
MKKPMLLIFILLTACVSRNPGRYYCTELAVDIYKPWHGPEDHLPRLIEPGQLYLWGRILYDSLERD